MSKSLLSLIEFHIKSGFIIWIWFFWIDFSWYWLRTSALSKIICVHWGFNKKEKFPPFSLMSFCSFFFCWRGKCLTFKQKVQFAKILIVILPGDSAHSRRSLLLALQARDSPRVWRSRLPALPAAGTPRYQSSRTDCFRIPGSRLPARTRGAAWQAVPVRALPEARPRLPPEAKRCVAEDWGAAPGLGFGLG